MLALALRPPRATRDASRPRLRPLTEVQLRSGSLVAAISFSWSWVMDPTFLAWGVPDPALIPAAALISSDAGGVLSTNVKERSSYTVMTTGMTCPTFSWGSQSNGWQLRMRVSRGGRASGPLGRGGDTNVATVSSLGSPGRRRLTCVAALYSLQNPMMLTPAAPSAGPTGGEGLAFPAGSASLIMRDTACAASNDARKRVGKSWMRGRSRGELRGAPRAARGAAAGGQLDPIPPRRRARFPAPSLSPDRRWGHTPSWVTAP